MMHNRQPADYFLLLRSHEYSSPALISARAAEIATHSAGLIV
jgi:hypothetical protein